MSISCAEIEFLAEKESIEIIPNFTFDRMYLITGDVGPFNPGLPLSVPLWLAVNLKQQQKCRICLPEWLNAESLTDVKTAEENSDVFTKMPNDHYMEMVKILLQVAIDDIPNADAIRTLIKDIWDLRIAKLRSSIDQFVQSGAIHAKLNHLTQMELNTVRGLITATMNNVLALRTAKTFSSPSQSSSQT